MDLTRIPVQYILKAAKAVKRLAYLIAVIGAAASYGTQVELLTSWGVHQPFNWAIPATIDLLAICAAIALQVPSFPDMKSVGAIMVFALVASIAANITAGDNVGQKISHAWPVLAYMLAEYIASRMRRYAAIVEAAQAAQTPPPVEAPLPPVHATATVGTPSAIAPAKKGTAKAAILELAAAKPRPADEEIAAKVGVKPGWVKHVIKTTTTA